MENSFTTFEGDPLEIDCSCGYGGYVFIKQFGISHITKCKKCHKNIYQLECPKCQTGYCYAEEDLTSIQEGSSWKCPACKAKNPIPEERPESIIPNYTWEEIPDDVKKKKLKPPHIIVKILVWGVIFSFVIFLISKIVQFAFEIVTFLR